MGEVVFKSTSGGVGNDNAEGARLGRLAAEMAEQICLGFRWHDRREYDRAVEAFTAVDTRQFPHLDAETARAASVAYVDALWAKDAVEATCTEDDELDLDALADADWSPVEEAFAERASLVGMDPRYAEASTLAWKRHKVGGDYAQPMQRAQVYELRAAMQDPEYPHKPHQGQSGYGPEAAQYLVAVELHDMHTEQHWAQARDVMTLYFDRVLKAHDRRRTPTPGDD
jgi:hypothetical protein